jgi:RNA polymerase sigma-70 factor (ECF subfamily)
MSAGWSEHARQDEQTLVAAAKSGDEAAFSALVRRSRRELHVHCYRMLGSLTEAEDVVQETFLRAWRKLDTFEGRSTLRAWLYRIATNACLDALAQRRPRLLPYDVVPPTAPGASPPASVEYLCVEPYPDSLLPVTADDSDLGASVVAKETIELAFLAAIQHLPPRQRAVLILRDVLGWPAKETAVVLEMTEVAVKSALQRARPVLKRRLPSAREQWAKPPSPSDAERALLDRYIAAHERDDAQALAEVLREDVRVSYPPHPLWRDSRERSSRRARKTRRPATTGSCPPAPTANKRSPSICVPLATPPSTLLRSKSSASRKDGSLRSSTSTYPSSYRRSAYPPRYEMNTDDDRPVRLLDRPLPPGLARRLVWIGPRERLPFEPRSWWDALVSVERGSVELIGESGVRRRFRSGDLLWLDGIRLAAIHNPGHEHTLLVAVARGSHVR